jgi:site-specific DNA recombinase
MRMAAIYARVSSEQQREANTIASQTASLIEFAQGHDLEVPKEWVFEDDGYSGATLERPGLERVRDLAAEGQIQVVLAYSPDRLSRKYAYQILLIEELARNGVETLFVKAPQGSSAEDQLLVQFQGMISEYERAQILERSRRGKRHRAQSGEVSVMSGAPYGYRYVRKTDVAPAAYVVVEAEARVVERIYEMYTVDGLSIGEITRRINAEGIPTRKASARWERSTVWAVLRNSAYRGVACFGKTRASSRTRVMRPQRRRGVITPSMTAGHERPREEWIEIPVPALVSEDSFARAQELLQENKVRSRRRTIEPSIVQGMVSCQKCGYAFSRTSTQTSARKIHYYKCIGSDSWRKLGGPVCDNGRYGPAGSARSDCLGMRSSSCWKTPRSYSKSWIVGWQQRARPIRPKSVSRVCKENWCMWVKASNAFSTPTRKHSCRSSSCGSACQGYASANRRSVLSCRQSLIRQMIGRPFCAWRKILQRSLPACVALLIR